MHICRIVELFLCRPTATSVHAFAFSFADLFPKLCMSAAFLPLPPAAVELLYTHVVQVSVIIVIVIIIVIIIASLSTIMFSGTLLLAK